MSKAASNKKELATDISSPALSLSEQFLVDAAGAASLLGISRSHFLSLYTSGRIGPMSINLGNRKLWSSDQLRLFCRLGCPPRDLFLEALKNG